MRGEMPNPKENPQPENTQVYVAKMLNFCLEYRLLSKHW